MGPIAGLQRKSVAAPGECAPGTSTYCCRSASSFVAKLCTNIRISSIWLIVSGAPVECRHAPATEAYTL